MKIHTICVLGGTGFVGRHLVNRLILCGHRVRVPSRHRERHRNLLVLPAVDIVETDFGNPAALQQALAGCDVVINLVGILNESRHASFRDIHVQLPGMLAQMCRSVGIRRLLHMSALNANAYNGSSRYLRSKGAGEDLVHQEAGDNLAVTSFRPSVIFGPEDHFFNQFSRLLKLAPGILLLPCPKARFAPVFVGDVVNTYVQAVDNKSTYGQRYDLCGPHAYSLRELVEYLAQVLSLRRKIIGLPSWLSRLAAHVMGHMPGKPLTYDNYLSMLMDAVCQQPSYPAAFDVIPRSIEAMVPYYLSQRQHPYLDTSTVD